MYIYMQNTLSMINFASTDSLHAKTCKVVWHEETGFLIIDNTHVYKIAHFFFLLPFGFLLVCCLLTSAIFLVLISRIKSKNALSTFSRVFADVSMYGLPHFVALASASSCLTVRLAVKSDLLPIRIIGMSSVFLTRNICSLFC
jgi:hypothetical protein